MISGTIYFNRSETGWICYSAHRALTSMMQVAPLWAASLIATVIAIVLTAVALAACTVNTLGKCLKLKSYSPYAFVHSGSRCR